MNFRRLHCFSCATMVALSFSLAAALQAATVTIVDDSFTDLNRAKTGALDADWWSSSSTSGNSVEIDANGLGLISGSSGRGIHATFSPQNLAVGETITVTYSFRTPASVGNNLSTAFKVALMDFNNPGLAADLNSQSGAGNENPLYQGLPGYMADFDVNTGATADVSLREHDTASTSGRFLGTTGEWISFSSSADSGYTFAPNTAYVGVFSATRTGADTLDLFSSISQGATLLDSHSDTDLSGIANNFGMFGIWANSNAFGNNTTAGDPNNGITLTNFKVEVTVIPEPSALVLMLVGTLFYLPGMRRR